MLYRVIGRSGSGKTEYIKNMICDAISADKNCVCIVPGQQSLDYEKDVFARFGAKANLYAEVLTFDRLPNRTYREYGGLASSYLDEGGRVLLMASAVDEVKDELDSFASVCDENAFIVKMMETSDMLKENNISFSLLENLDGESKISEKSHETGRILSAYQNLVKNGFGDSSDELTLYAESLIHMPFFKGKTVFIDSFNSFTEQQHKVIDRIVSQADDVYVTLTYDASDKSGMFTTPSFTYDRLARFARAKDIDLGVSKRFKSESLRYAEQNLWNTSAVGMTDDDGNIEFVECVSRFEEAEAAAMEVVKLLKSGMRYRDIVIIARAPEEYFGIIDTVFEKHCLPCYFSAKENLLIKPLIVFVMASLEAVNGNFTLQSMKKLIKSGYLPISEKQSELLLRYADTWNIRGKMWIREDDWLMNPSGCKAEFDKYENYVLKEVNKAKKVVTEVMSQFSSDIESASNGEEAAKAIYSLLESVNASETVRKKASELRLSGSEDSAFRLTHLWDILINALDQLYNVYKDKKVTPSLIANRMELMISEYSLESVPSSCDSVTIGSASVYKGNSPRAVILLGVNDGVFPATPSLNGIFNISELEELESKGIYLDDSFETMLENEKLFFYIAVSMATEKLVCIYSSASPSRPSVGEIRLRTLFPNAKLVKFGEKIEEQIFSLASARENSVYADEEAYLFLDERGLNDALTVKKHPLCDTNAKVNTVKTDFMNISPTRLEKYTYCAFSYFGKYMLGLSKPKKAEFNHAEIGVFIHKVLEIFVSERMKNGTFVYPTEGEISKRVDELTDAYIGSVFRGINEKSKRFVYALERLKVTLRILLKSVSDEIASSSFLPIGFEIPSSEAGSVYVTEHGLKVRLNGVIDRIDEFTKNGKKYIRITDYKTGSKVFDRKALDNGLDMQMFLYLFAYCSFHGETYPAGVTYLPARLETLKCASSPEEGELESMTEKALKRSGLIIDDVEIIDSLEEGSKKRFIPVTFNADGTIRASSSIASAEEFGKIRLKAENQLKKIASLISEGEMSVSPLKINENYDACRYCDIREICRLSNENKIVRRGSGKDE